MNEAGFPGETGLESFRWNLFEVRSMTAPPVLLPLRYYCPALSIFSLSGRSSSASGPNAFSDLAGVWRR